MSDTCCYRGCEGCAEYANAPQTTRTAQHAVRDWRAMPTDEVNAAFRELGDAIQRVRALHCPTTDGSEPPLCSHDWANYPCDTIRMLNKEEA